jgi:hypothetical protein
MQEQHVYEYAVIRVLPRVEREEFLNVGLILFCKRKKYIRMQFQVNPSKLAMFSSELELDELIGNLNAFEQISLGNHTAGPMAMEEVAERFRWLTAVRSSCIQTSRPHPGMSSDLDATFEKLFNELVL